MPRGTYVATDEYNRLDLVSYGGSSFIVLKDGIKGITPVADNVNYMLSAKEGGKGDTGSIENLDAVTVAFTEATARANIGTGETFAVLFGKVKKFFTDLKALAFKDKVDWSTDIENKPSKVSQFTNDSDFQTSTQVKTTVSTHNASDSAHSDIRTEIASVRLVAEGALVGYAFDTVADMNSWIAVAANKAKLKIGNSLFIRATDVPDYWWDGATALAVEGEKVNLSGYLLSSVAANTYVEKITGKGLSLNDFTNEYKEVLDYNNDGIEVDGLSNIPSTKKIVYAEISENAALSFASSLTTGEQTVFIYNNSSSEVIVTLPSSSEYVNPYGTTLAISSGSYAEVNRSYMKPGVNNIRAAV